MALALLFQDDSVMYIDAVTNYTKSYSSSVSRHPIDKSAVVTDHVTKDNPSFSLRGVISAADFNNLDVPLEDESGDLMVSDRAPVSGAEITTQSSLLDYLPGSIQQFISSTDPTEVTVDEFRGFSHQIARDRLNQAWENSEVITLLDYDYDFATGRSSSVRTVENCVIRNYTDSEDAQTGDAFEFTITFERLRFAYLREVDLRVSQVSVADTTSEKSDKGDQNSGTSSSSSPSSSEGVYDGFYSEKNREWALSVLQGE